MSLITRQGVILASSGSSCGGYCACNLWFMHFLFLLGEIEGAWRTILNIHEETSRSHIRLIIGIPGMHSLYLIYEETT